MTTGSNPVFPIMLYNYTFSYVLNMININKARKSLYFDLLFTSKTIKFVKLFNRLNYIFRYEMLKDKKIFIRIYLTYSNSVNLGKNFKIISKPSHKFYVTCQSLRLLQKKTGDSVFIISTSYGLLTHKEALTQNTGGLVLGFFSV